MNRVAEVKGGERLKQTKGKEEREISKQEGEEEMGKTGLEVGQTEGPGKTNKYAFCYLSSWFQSFPMTEFNEKILYAL